MKHSLTRSTQNLEASMNTNLTQKPFARGSISSNAAWMQYFKRVGFDLVKGVVGALASMVGLVAGGIITAMLGLPATGLPLQVDMNTLMPRLFLTQIVIAIVLGKCFQGLYHRYWQRLLSIWLCNYVLYYLLNILDGLLFSPFPNMSTGIVANVFPALFMAAVTAWLWKPGAVVSPKDEVRDYFAARKAGEWAWRLALAWLVFPLIYYLMGRAVLPFVHQYYEDPSLRLGLTMPPSLEILMAMQVLRGALFLLAVLPILVAWHGSRKSLWLWVGTVIFIQIAIQTILQAYWLPTGLRFPHGLELLADSFLQAGVYALLLFFPAKPMKEPLPPGVA
jgi:hypothetical protein